MVDCLSLVHQFLFDVGVLGWMRGVDEADADLVEALVLVKVGRLENGHELLFDDTFAEPEVVVWRPVSINWGYIWKTTCLTTV